MCSSQRGEVEVGLLRNVGAHCTRLLYRVWTLDRPKSALEVEKYSIEPFTKILGTKALKEEVELIEIQNHCPLATSFAPSFDRRVLLIDARNSTLFLLQKFSPSDHSRINVA